eukprot:5432854-Amphidinium_carterae.1
MTNGASLCDMRGGTFGFFANSLNIDRKHYDRWEPREPPPAQGRPSDACTLAQETRFALAGMGALMAAKRRSASHADLQLNLSTQQSQRQCQQSAQRKKHAAVKSLFLLHASEKA